MSAPLMIYFGIALYALGTLRAEDWPDKSWRTMVVSVIASLIWPLVIVDGLWQLARRVWPAATPKGGAK